MTKHLSAIHNAWHFWFASSFVFKAQCGSRCVLRCSRLNAALCFFEVINDPAGTNSRCRNLV
ncbi:TPA: DUF3265 domain-containing protein [Vibrio parahaemolyticus]|nr:DUF3265 domain-containing protein [Vibrio parahaemolyticus]HCE2588724.1 DUF3265 domain-containing protein [Vibrio parahaemolyticus]HCG8728549.1 DUF3265 domain-containing protein [Vibrio parahaemolyticus]HCH1697101.1 DUF3265 domain-containing protein [Vibrio parahaemolyticus]HCM0406018.1 DUF3265 domain-containing protein [Vibrio parahaemolyticus]